MKRFDLDNATDAHFAGRYNLFIVSIVILTSIVWATKVQSMEIIVSWCVIIVLVGNVKRINNNTPLLYFIRMTGYFLPYLVPYLLFGEKPIILCAPLIEGCIFSVFAFCIWVYAHNDEIKVMLSDQLALDSIKAPRWAFAMRVYSVLGSAICEELYFRGFILGLNMPNFAKIMISIIYFSLSHVVLPWGNLYKAKDVLSQLLIGSCSVVAFYIGKCTIPCVLLHMLINSITAIKHIKAYDRHYGHIEKYERLQNGSLFGDKEL